MEPSLDLNFPVSNFSVLEDQEFVSKNLPKSSHKKLLCLALPLQGAAPLPTRVRGRGALRPQWAQVTAKCLAAVVLAYPNPARSLDVGLA